MRAARLRIDGGRCVICGQRAVVVDHVVSRRAGGADALANLRSLCRAHDNGTKEDATGKRRSGGIFGGCDSKGNPLDPNHPWNAQ